MLVLCLVLAFNTCCLADEAPEDQVSVYQFGEFYVGLPSEWSGVDLDGMYVFAANHGDGNAYVLYFQTHEVDGDAMRQIGLSAFYGLYFDRLGLKSIARESYPFYDTYADVYSGVDGSGEQICGSVLLYGDSVLIITAFPYDGVAADAQFISDILDATIPSDKTSVEDLMGIGATPEPSYPEFDFSSYKLYPYKFDRISFPIAASWEIFPAGDSCCYFNSFEVKSIPGGRLIATYVDDDVAPGDSLYNSYVAVLDQIGVFDFTAESVDCGGVDGIIYHGFNEWSEGKKVEMCGVMLSYGGKRYNLYYFNGTRPYDENMAFVRLMASSIELS